jgi:leader peptidase (prepilin peptidase)/N-methyltransferase
LAIRNLFAFVGPNYFWYWALSSFIWIVAFMFLLVAFIIDVYHYLIPNSVNLTLLIISVIWIAIGIYFGAFQNAYSGSFLKQFQAIFPSFQSVLANHILGGIAPALFFLLIFIFSGQKAIGMGDVKLIGSLGFLFGWPDIILITFLSFVIGAIVSIFLIILKKKKITDKIPFGPFIVISASIVFFFGAGLMNAYFAIIGI